ncbi:hypothetical protein KEM52_005878 [Ascosphaera acerosa]|nr:hypothetical protein KEM52_005878 [Ascosphaera acerosa]
METAQRSDEPVTPDEGVSGSAVFVTRDSGEDPMASEPGETHEAQALRPSASSDDRPTNSRAAAASSALRQGCTSSAAEAPTQASSGEKASKSDTAAGPAAMPAPAYLVSQLDAIIRRLAKLVSTNTGEDRVIGTCGYSAQIIHYLISPAFASLLNRYRSFRGQASIVAPSISNKDVAKLSPKLLALSALASETRMTLRLLGLFPLLSWGSSTLKSPPKDKVLGPVIFTQIISIICYQFLENVAWLTAKGVLPPVNFIVRRLGGVSRTMMHSVRFWLFYMILQIVKVARERYLARKQRLSKEATGKWDQESIRAEAEGSRAAKKTLVTSLSWLPLCMHWSFERGIGVPQELVGLISFTAGAWALRDLWVDTADVA